MRASERLVRAEVLVTGSRGLHVIEKPYSDVCQAVICRIHPASCLTRVEIGGGCSLYSQFNVTAPNCFIHDLVMEYDMMLELTAKTNNDHFNYFNRT